VSRRTDVIARPKVNVRYIWAYIGWMAQTQEFIAGTEVDLRGPRPPAAHSAAIDYLGDVAGSEGRRAKAW